MNPDPRIDPKLAIDLGDEHAKTKRAEEEAAQAAAARDMRKAASWYKAMRRMTGQRDRFDVFLRAEIRRQRREGSS